jgi:hypothetical protein
MNRPPTATTPAMMGTAIADASFLVGVGEVRAAAAALALGVGAGLALRDAAGVLALALGDGVAAAGTRTVSMTKTRRKRQSCQIRRSETRWTSGGETEYGEGMLTVDDTVVDDGIRRNNVGGDGSTLDLASGEGDGEVLTLDGEEGLTILEISREEDSGDDCMRNRNSGFSATEYEKKKKKRKERRSPWNFRISGSALLEMLPALSNASLTGAKMVRPLLVSMLLRRPALVRALDSWLSAFGAAAAVSLSLMGGRTTALMLFVFRKELQFSSHPSCD